MPKQAKASLFDLIYIVRVVGDGKRMYDMPKHAKAA